jgi:hypothetical protein
MNVIQTDPGRHSQLLHEIEDLNVAAKIVDGEFQAETRLAGYKLLEAVKPETTRLGNAYAKAFVALQLAKSEYDSFVDEVESTATNVESLRLHIRGLDDCRDPTGSFAYGRREFANMGYLPKSQAAQAI